MFRRYVCVRQGDQSDCGPAALATIALHHGLRVSRERLRDVTGTDRIGTNLLGLLKGGERLGLRGRAVKGDWAGLSTVPLPAIAHVRTPEGLGHYVVIHRVLADAVIVADPAFGIEKRTKEAFCASWTGYALLLSPAPEFTPGGDTTPGARFLQLVLRQRGLLIEAFVCALLMTVLGLSTSVFVQHLVDGVLVQHQTSLLDALGIGMIVVVVFRAAFGALRQYLIAFAGRHSGFHLLADYTRHVLQLPMRFFELRQTGDVLSRVQDAVKVRDAISGVTLSLLVDAAMVAFALVALWFQDTGLALIASLFVPVLVLSSLVHQPAARRRTRAVMEESARVQSQLVEDVSGIETIKALGLEPVRREEGEIRLANLLGSAFGQQKLGISTQTAATLLMGAAGVVVLWYGGHRVIDGKLSIGQLMFFYTLLGYLLQPLERLAGAHLALEDAIVALDRLYQVMDLELEPGRDKGLPCHGIFTGIALEDVTFKYGSRAAVLDKVSLDIPAGKRVALLGESGSGKTTLLKLLQRLYDPTEGRITIDGVDVRDLGLDALRGRIAVVSQDPFLFAGTLRENLLAARPGASPEDLLEAIKIAGLEEVIAALPERLETVVGDRGTGLSGGQRQRVAIARAVLKRPDLLLLDEATSHLDSTTEAAVQTALDSVLHGKTVVIVAHRLATVRSADLIYVLHRGKVVERGSHRELILKNGKYAAAWRAQLGTPANVPLELEPELECDVEVTCNHRAPRLVAPRTLKEAS
ncbi:MAG: peptidase domain-containing ABC transporter [Myxococcales bacterium]|nr:peptidase domain-containing ABC transporter [Myxococcales bacterium]